MFLCLATLSLPFSIICLLENFAFIFYFLKGIAWPPSFVYCVTWETLVSLSSNFCSLLFLKIQRAREPRRRNMPHRPPTTERNYKTVSTCLSNFTAWTLTHISASKTAFKLISVVSFLKVLFTMLPSLVSYRSQLLNSTLLNFEAKPQDCIGVHSRPRMFPNCSTSCFCIYNFMKGYCFFYYWSK